ncbi:ATP-binding protein [Stigmatella aurantiaca]|uniref:ATPase domain-containing protein n=1 Tax=Stigmatella aurantiaca (strain DW4/3-1) TaxID=378806 RepID=Q08TB7_STIAD|nr:ATP-binding protein [Stigmatella aurantiaca]ADO75929.1 uncharacterized protein STAUR_8174 [Stigmatella aurantiaca DW4/3-1]EAU63729.1 hypothetical protein STIAU_3227 [Stigmatella aurantiaca DW4/3-1]
MRLRHEGLKTGRLLTCFPDANGLRNASLLFLVEGVSDITPLQRLDDALRPEMDASLRWSAAASTLDLARVDPRLDPGKVTRLEAGEFRDLVPEDIRAVLSPGLVQLRRGEAARFPSATRMEGSVVTGPDFLERAAELAALQEHVERRQHTVVLAPRRAGKTSLLYRLAEVLDERFRVELFDVEEHRTPEGFTAALLSRASGKSHTSALRETREQGWEAALPAAIRALAGDRKRRLVLILDELVFFLEHLKKRDFAKAFLTALDAAVEQAKATVIIAGSANLMHFARNTLRLTLPGLFGALTPVSLSPLPAHTLEIQLRRVLLGTGLVLESGDMAWFHENFDLAMPYPALRFLSHLASAARERKLGPEALDAELTAYLRTPAVFAELKSQLNHLAEEDAAQAERVEDVVGRLARVSSLKLDDVKAKLGGAKGASTFEWLVTHFPVHLEGQNLMLASRLFRRYWQESTQ